MAKKLEDRSEPRRPRQDRRPLCPDHQVQMVATSSNVLVTYYRCPHAGCRQTAKQVRPHGPLKDLYGNGESGQT